MTNSFCQTANPFPNVDSASGALFHHYGFRETLYYTATFGVSRGLGPLAQLIWVSSTFTYDMTISVC